MDTIIEKLSDYKLIELCNDIYELHTGNGDLNKDSLLVQVYTENQKDFGSMHHFKDLLLFEANRRFEKLVKILFLTNPHTYINTRK